MEWSKECKQIVVTPDGAKVCEDTGEVISESTFVEYAALARDRQALQESRPAVSNRHHTMNIGAQMSEYARNRNPLSRSRAGWRRVRTKSGISRDDIPTITALQILREASEVLRIPDTVQETAAMILRSYLNSLNRRPANIDVYVAASLVKAVEIHSIPVSRGEISSAMGISQTSLQRAVLQLSETKIVRDLTRNTIKKAKDLGRSSKLDRINEFINRLIANLNLDSNVKVLAINFVKKSLEAEGKYGRKNFDGKKSAALAAAAVYLAARLLGHEISQKKIAQVLKLKESNIRKHYRFLMDNVAIVVYV